MGVDDLAAKRALWKAHPAFERTIQCPGCGIELQESDWERQIAHMQSEHPEIIEERLERAGIAKPAQAMRRFHHEED